MLDQSKLLAFSIKKKLVAQLNRVLWAMLDLWFCFYLNVHKFGDISDLYNDTLFFFWNHMVELTVR